MFNRTKKAILRRNRFIKGNIKGYGILEVRGKVSGNISVTHLEVGRRAHIIGHIEAETVQISGYVEGNIQARHVIIEKGAQVNGELIYEQLSVASQADLSGKLTPSTLESFTPAPTPVEDIIATLQKVA